MSAPIYPNGPLKGEIGHRTVAAYAMDKTDQMDLAILVGQGDPVAQEHFIALLRPRARRIAMAIMAHHQDAEDVTQNILIELLRSAHSFKGGSLRAWSDKIGIRTAIREARKRSVRSTRTTAEVDMEGLGLERLTKRREEVPRPIVEYLAELPEVRRTVLVLRHVLEYSIDEIAELTECSPNTVKDRLQHARMEIRRTIRRESLLDVSKRSDPTGGNGP